MPQDPSRARSGAQRKATLVWKKFDPSAIKGTKMPGDRDVPPTTWWNVLWLKFFVWKSVATFKVVSQDAKRGYRLGYKAHDGTCRLLSKVLHDDEIAVRMGREDCTFFAIDADGQEIWLRPHLLTGLRRLREYGIRLV